MTATGQAHCNWKVFPWQIIVFVSHLSACIACNISAVFVEGFGRPGYTRRRYAQKCSGTGSSIHERCILETQLSVAQHVAIFASWPSSSAGSSGGKGKGGNERVQGRDEDKGHWVCKGTLVLLMTWPGEGGSSRERLQLYTVILEGCYSDVSDRPDIKLVGTTAPLIRRSWPCESCPLSSCEAHLPVRPRPASEGFCRERRGGDFPESVGVSALKRFSFCGV